MGKFTERLQAHQLGDESAADYGIGTSPDRDDHSKAKTRQRQDMNGPTEPIPCHDGGWSNENPFTVRCLIQQYRSA